MGPSWPERFVDVKFFFRKWETWFIQTAVGDYPMIRANATIQTRTFLFGKRLPTAPVKPGTLL
jgi:hypothetical protein